MPGIQKYYKLLYPKSMMTIISELMLLLINAWTYFREWWNRNKEILLKSAEGEALLREAAVRQTLLIRIFSVQEKMGYCGIHSAALLMSARYFGKKFPLPDCQFDCDVCDVPYADRTMFSLEETTRILDHDQVLKRGATLHEIQRLLQSHGLPTTKIYAKDIDVDTFRSRAIEALSHSDSSQGVIVNYLYSWATESGVVRIGHFSPLAAYHSDTDRFLLLDVWDGRRGEWVKTNEMFNLMNTSDADSNIQSRGFLISGIEE